MGYNADKDATLFSPPSGKRKRKLNFTLEVKGKERKSTETSSVFAKQHIQNQPNMLQRCTSEMHSPQCTSDFNLSSQIVDSGHLPLENFEGLDD